MSKDEIADRIAFSVWTNFLKYVSPNAKKVKTVDDFIKSPDYIGFIKFANYIIVLKPMESEKFIHWLFKMGVRMSDWQKPGTYQLFIQESSKLETAERALEKTIISMREWSEVAGEDWQDFFKKVPSATAMNMVVMGKISPWIIYSSDAVQLLLDRMEPGQIETVTKHVDTEWWKKKLKENPQEATWINTTMQQAIGLSS
jgi:hypothetical protein